ncbi:TetR/AcrR family transcriptional regulator [Saccharomonospora xinjiangensis]|uniref:Transcriptional regulator n=1 Tax=Saccharomonospora xinjiangensis XJ-54 TaxID=882086 RepID=I0V7T0_9PSEU|nr:TetR/AcrR family transcriptional regulator [Saccharomonospora xinjiangensis]EID56183.1 transcriptional regulator [Saccharomonospora xinjiangensis XJ-54]
MPRPREFDEDTAVAGALRAFRATGYEATSTQELCEATGLGRSSVYNAFGSKHELFRRALHRYFDDVLRHFRALVAEQRPARETFRAVFTSVLDDEAGPDAPGCFAVNTASELGGRDPAITKALHRHGEEMISLYTEIVERGQRDGELKSDATPEAVAQFVFATVGGLRVLARNGFDRTALENVAERALAAL